jgi:hypothetical protein
LQITTSKFLRHDGLHFVLCFGAGPHGGVLVDRFELVAQILKPLSSRPRFVSPWPRGRALTHEELRT